MTFEKQNKIHMKKLFYFSAMALSISLFIYSCDKGQFDSKTNEENANTELKKKSLTYDSFDEWIEVYGDSLSSIVRQDIIIYDVQMQKEIFRRLPAERKSFVWREKFQSFQNSRNLSNKQVTFVESLIEITSPAFFDRAIDETLNKELKKLITEGLNYFDDRKLLLIMTELGDEISIKTSRAIGGGFNVSCECSLASDWCDFLGSSRSKCGGDCVSVSSGGCGTFWVYDCDGRCLLTIGSGGELEV